MENFLRAWRKDALDKHQYDSAVFIADKLLALTSTYFSYIYIYISRNTLTLLLYLTHIVTTNIISQTTTKMPSSWRKFISRQAITRARKAS